MELKLYQVDTFASEVFKGNPAAICPLESWLPDKTMQNIASENNLSETAFYIPSESGFHIRWFTPTSEVDLCGHATLACAHVIFHVLDYKKTEIKFESKSGPLFVKKNEHGLQLNFPNQKPVPCDTPAAITRAFSEAPIQCLKSEDYILVFEHEESVETLQPDFSELSKLDLRGVVITARSEEFDFISRCFAPKYGINEDPVTGSTFTELAPYWAEVLNKNTLHAKQVSERSGEVFCELQKDRVLISGKSILYMVASIYI
jgi:PhzF family phenazine biosynthesis protein